MVDTSKMPWVRFFPSDWLGGTRGMTAAETGIYITLLMTMYERGKPLPEDNARLARLCGASNSVFKSTLESLIEQGKLERSEDGLICVNIDLEGSKPRRKYIDAATRKAVQSRDGEVCFYCGDTEGPFHFDHIHPVALGGTNDIDNLTISCRSCNLSKGAKTLDEWRSVQ